MRGTKRALLGVAVIAAATASLAETPERMEVAAFIVVDDRPAAEAPSLVPSREQPVAAPVSTELPVASAEPPADPVDATDRILPVGTGGRGISATVRTAYERAAELTAAADPGCGLSWELLAGIGRIESGHASGGRVDDRGTTDGRILGPRLDGIVAGVAWIADSDGGELDGDTAFDRAVGPMQFIPATWARYGADGNDDGVRDPHNVHDASLAAARYLCADGGDLRNAADLTEALYRYNRSATYALDVRAWAEAYRTGGAPVIPAQRGPVPEPSPSTVPPDPAVLAQPDDAEVPPVEATADPMTSASEPTPDAAGTSAPDTTTVTEGPPTTTSEPTTQDAANCTSVVLTPASATVLPDGSGVLVRFPLDELPPECKITAATLAFDPGPDAAERAVQVERVTDEWSDTTTDRPGTDGDPVVVDAAVGERLWSVEALIAALVEDPDRGVLFTVAGEGDPVALQEVAVRLEVLLGPAETG